MRRTYLILIIFLFGQVLFSQRPEIRFDRISVSDGLLDHSINCITQDHSGYIWIGGSDGLYKFDGYEFTSFMFQPGEERSRYFKDVYRIAEDKRGYLWLAVAEGIVLFDPSTRWSRLVIKYTTEQQSGVLFYRPDILIDESDEIWGTYRNGLVRITVGEGINELIRSEDTADDFDEVISKHIIDFPGSAIGKKVMVTTLYDDNHGNILAGTTSGLFSCNTVTLEVRRLIAGSDEAKTFGADNIRDIIQAKDGSYWLAAGNYIIKVSGSFDHPEENFSRLSLNENQIPTSILEDRQGNIILGTNKAICQIRESDGKTDLITLDSNEDDPEYYGYIKDIRDIFEDRSGLIWTAQDYYGITRFRHKGPAFNSYKDLIVENFTSTDVNPLFKDAKGVLWIGTYGDGLYKMEPGSFRITHYDLFRQKNNVNSITEIKPGVLWIGTERGIVEFDAPDGRSGDPSSLALSEINQKEINVWYLLKDGSNIFIGTTKGLYVFNIEKNALSRINPENSDRLPDTDFTVYSLSRSDVGEILAGTTQGVFKVISLGSGFKMSLLADTRQMENLGLSPDRRHSIYCDGGGLLWIADYSGLHNLDLKTSEISNIRLFENINFPVAWSVTGDNKNNLWIGTHFGLCRYNKLSGLVKVYTREDGLPLTIHGVNSVLREKDGRLWFGGIGGFYDFHPDSLPQNDIIPPVVITDIKVMNRSISGDMQRSVYKTAGISGLRTIKLPREQNDVSFEFSSLDYNQPSENQYMYKLEGYQDQWIRSDAKNRVASYLKLKPGNYTFTVKGSNSDGIWNETGASVMIIVRKPWWQTYAALTFFLIIIYLVLRGVFRLRLYNLEKERKELEEQVGIRTREIKEQTEKIAMQKELLEQQNRKIREEEELKSRFFANISHEFRTPLTLIKTPAEELIADERLNQKEIRKVNMISRNAQRLLNLVNQLLDISKFDSNMMTLDLCESDPMKHLKAVTDSFTSLAEIKSIDFRRYFDDNKILAWFDQDKIEKIVTNLLSNAFKFTPAGGQIDLSAKYRYGTLTEVPVSLEISVRDNGPGIPQESIDKIFDRFFQVKETLGTDNVGTGIGLSLARDLARLMHGEISVQSEIGAGSHFTVMIPLGKDHLKENEFVIVNYQTSVKENPDMTNYGESEIADDEIEASHDTQKKPLALIVEDNRDMRDQLLENLGSEYQIIVAVDGVAGMMKALEQVPDIIITDLMMPNMDGLELCGQLKENEVTCHIPIIMLTARDTLVDKINGLQKGADDYIPKPFSLAELKARMANLIGQRQKLREMFSREITLEPTGVSIKSADAKFLERAVALVEEHIKDETFGMDEFRSGMNLSKSTLFRKLAALTNQSPSEFIRTIRLKRAASLLRQDFGNITEIALEVGFNNISYFNRSFKKLYGVSPSEYIRIKE